MNSKAKFTIRELLIAILVIAVIVCWYVDHRKLSNRIAVLKTDAIPFEIRLEGVSGLTGQHREISFIRALTDPDFRIAKKADERLRELTKSEGFGNVEFGMQDSEVLKLVHKWTELMIAQEVDANPKNKDSND